MLGGTPMAARESDVRADALAAAVSSNLQNGSVLFALEFTLGHDDIRHCNTFRHGLQLSLSQA